MFASILVLSRDIQSKLVAPITDLQITGLLFEDLRHEKYIVCPEIISGSEFFIELKRFKPLLFNVAIILPSVVFICSICPYVESPIVYKLDFIKTKE